MAKVSSKDHALETAKIANIRRNILGDDVIY